MAKNKSNYYFNNFAECAALALNGAQLLCDIMTNFDSNKLPEYKDKMHEIEHTADLKKHELLEVLLKTFITPIDREDILQVSNNIDELCDKVEDVLIRLYIHHVKIIHPDAIEFVKVIVEGFSEVEKLMQEFANFKHSKTLKEHIIKINSLEEKADKIYINGLYNLYEDSHVNILDALAWRDIFTFLEKCADTCEHIADIVESVAMKNT